jgi:hypothetical protein
MSTEEEKPRANPPVHEIADGPLKAAIWQQEGEYGPRYYVTIRRRYKDGEEWKDAKSFSADDLLPAAELCRDAYAWIKKLKQADARARKEREAEAA